MKIKTSEKSYAQVSAIPVKGHVRPIKPNIFFRTLLKVASVPDLASARFKCEKKGMERLGKKEPALYLMNHSSFIDLEIAASILYPRPFNIVCTTDGFVGKTLLMRLIGCIPTKKFVADIVLVRDMLHCLRTLKSSVLMYPEASYSFDGTVTPLPESLGKCLKMLKVPVVMIRTCGAFGRDPLYNGLQKRKVNVTAEMKYLLSPDDIKNKTAEELNDILAAEFSFDNFRWQKENGIRITEPFRADMLNRVLYKCPACNAEGNMVGKGIYLRCSDCGKTYELTELGEMRALEGETEMSHIPDWYRWQRDCVRKETEEKTYKTEIEVDIYMLVDTDCVYKVGEGVLEHTASGFYLTGCDGELEYFQKPTASYSVYSDYFWYEIGDVVCIGDNRALYYCFPKTKKDVVAKIRLAAEEMYKAATRQ